MSKVKRKSNIELLRILCILLVIAGHFYVHSDWGEISAGNLVLLKIFGGGAKLAVNCFILITGYFGSNIQSKRVLSIIRDRWFYSILVTAFLLIVGICNIGGKLILQTFFPLLTCRHNYITVFVMLYFFIPFLNRSIEAIGKRNLEKLLIISTIFFSIVPTVYPGFANNTYAYILWMMFLFSVGRYLGTYNLNLPWKILFLCSYGMVLIFLFIIEPNVEIYSENYSTAMQYSFPLFIASISLLEIFAHLKINYSKLINGLAESTFAVYILHDDPNIRGYIWSQIFQNQNYGDSPYLWLHYLRTVLCIYFTCVIINKIYRFTIYKFLIKIPVKKAEDAIDRLCALESLGGGYLGS